MSKFEEVVERIFQEDPSYDRAAYEFVRQGLNFTLKYLDKKGLRKGGGHISGQQLLEGLRLFTLEQFGPLSLTVLDFWNIRSCRDFGSIVFKLVDHGVLGKTESDSIDDFENGYDFNEAFARPFEPHLSLGSSK